MERRHWALLAVAFGDGKPLTPVQLQKSLFLLGQNMPNAVGIGFYRFTPYNYGPFDSAVYSDAEQLAREGALIAERQLGRSWLEYRVTPQGTERAYQLRASVRPEAWEYLNQVVEWVRSLSFKQLVTAIYERYPEQRTNSVFSA